MKKLIFLFTLLLSFHSSAQLNIQWLAEDTYPVDTIPIFNWDVGTSALTPLVDILGRPYLYVSANQGGLIIYETDPILTPIYTVDTTILGQVTSTLIQRDTILYVGTGSIFSDTLDSVGVVVLNVADPNNPIILDKWIDPNKTPGVQTSAGVMRIQGDFLYIGGMAEGLVILNIADPSNLSFVSKYAPSIQFPHPGNTQAKVNARGMTIQDSLIYLCYDAGGMRVINCSNINAPIEINAFANSITYVPSNQPRAYNNVVKDDTLLYIAVDYCGLEIWNIADPLNPSMVTHWNPVNCPVGGWWEAPIHANELILQKECGLLYLATGKSELNILDISNAAMPVLVDSFGTVLDTTGTWGIDISDNRIYLTYVYVGSWVPSFLTPFYSNWSGVKQLSYSKCDAGEDEIEQVLGLSVYPNPADNSVTISMGQATFEIQIYSLQGKNIFSEIAQNELTLNTTSWEPGMYLIQIKKDGLIYKDKLIIGR